MRTSYRTVRKISCALCLILLFFYLIAPCAYSAMYEKEKILSPYAAVYNTENDTFIFEKNANQIISSTATAKLMTAILTVEHYKGNLSAKVTITTESIKNVDKAVAGFKVGDTVSVKDLLYASLIANCTYSASVLAYSVAGSQAEFAKKMNAKAEELGLEDTVYQSATCFGANIEHSHTTVRDSVILSAYAMKNTTIAEIVNTAKYTFESFTSSLNQTIRTKNGFISKFVYGDAYYWKHGDEPPAPRGVSYTYSEESGYSLISSMNYRSLTYICMCSGAFENSGNRIVAYDDIEKLFIWASEEYTTLKVLDKARIFGEIPVKLSEQSNYVVVVPENSLYAFLPHDTDISKEIKQVYKITEKELTAPVEIGQVVGTLSLYLGDKEIASCNLVTKSPIARSDALAFQAALFSPPMIIGIALSLIAACLFGIIRYFAFLNRSKTPSSNRGEN